MPRKKAAATSDGGDNEGNRFRWTAENDRMLLLLCCHPNLVPKELQEFVKVMPAGANFEGIRQRYSKLRREKRQIFEDNGWEFGGNKGGAIGAKKTTNVKKKKRSIEADDDEENSQKPVKKTKITDDGEKSIKRTKDKGKKAKVEPEVEDNVEDDYESPAEFKVKGE